jgi:NifU-like protein
MSEALLTSDFIYLKGKSSEQLSDLVMLAGAELDDYTTSQNSVGVAPVSDIEVKIKLILRLVISPLLKKDGGNIELVEYANNVVKVRFLGKCQGCPYAQNTLKNHVEKKMIQYLPYISKVELV